MSHDDELLRSQLRNRGRDTDDAHTALVALRPAMKRARLRRRAAIGSAAVAVLGFGGIGTVAAIRAANPAETVQTTSSLDGQLPRPTDPVAATTAEAPWSSGPVVTSTPGTVSRSSSPTTVAAGAPPTTTPANVPATGTASPTTNTVDERPATTAGPTTTSAATTTSAPAPSSVPTSTSPPTPQPTTTAPAATPTTTTPTTTAASGTQTITSTCGTVNVSYTATTVRLTATAPKPGFVVDIKESGPDKIEVGFENGIDECEVKARMVSGSLIVDVDNHDDS